jgi:hypothetical protein
MREWGGGRPGRDIQSSDNFSGAEKPSEQTVRAEKAVYEKSRNAHCRALFPNARQLAFHSYKRVSLKKARRIKEVDVGAFIAAQ